MVLEMLGLALLGVAILPSQAMAGCTDPAAPSVNWRRCNMNRLQLENADLTGATLLDASFSSTVLTAATLKGVDGRRAKFIGAALEGAIFDGARLNEADFTSAKLNGAHFHGTDLRRARFFAANLRNAEFTGARLDGADFFNADFSGALWTDGASRCAEGSIGRCVPAGH